MKNISRYLIAFLIATICGPFIYFAGRTIMFGLGTAGAPFSSQLFSGVLRDGIYTAWVCFAISCIVRLDTRRSVLFCGATYAISNFCAFLYQDINGLLGIHVLATAINLAIIVLVAIGNAYSTTFILDGWEVYSKSATSRRNDMEQRTRRPDRYVV